ncbi:MAG TPA: response regulator transcription factor [Candidatus Xenobia bacterium]|jgi:DNA-binding NarL/FixJ family response regulator
MSTVLIADDHAILRDGIRTLLENEEDIQVVGQAANGREAVHLACDLKPDIVLMDIQMPEVDGIEACERIGRQAPTVKVLILSQLDTEEHLIRVLEVGAQGYVLKQNASEELITAIQTVAHGHVYLTPSMASRLVNRYLRREDEKAQKSKQLTGRESDVLKGICEGITNQQIADNLNLSIKTVQSHRANIMEKLDLHNRVDLVKYAIKMGLATADE